jgi:two-component system sensor histidine kinase TctE
VYLLNKPFSQKSLRFQLILAASIALFLISLLSLLAVKHYAYETTLKFYDRQLSNAGLLIIDRVKFNGLVFNVDLPFSAFKILADSPRDKVYYLVTTQKRNLVTGYPELLKEKRIQNIIQKHQIKLEPKAEYFYLNFKQERVRFSIISRSINTREGAYNIYVLVGQTTQAREVWDKKIMQQAIKILLAVVIGALLVILILIRKVLKPINEINKKIAKRSNLDLTPITLEGPREINHLIKTINVFMSELDGTLNNLKNFTSEAAHQLKTPIAGIKAQIELATSKAKDQETIVYLIKVTSACDVLERTVTQLLNHATIKHRYRRIEPKELNSNDLVKNVCRDLAIHALSKNIELSYQESLIFNIKGDEFSLSQMMINLLDNAITHSPIGSVIEVEIKQEGSKAVVFIRDFGLGIDDKDKPYVFDKFYRSPNINHQGTGLGMSIALDVAQKSHATLSLEDSDPHGLTIKVKFPHTFWWEVS